MLQLEQLFLINLNKQWGFDKQIITIKLNSFLGGEKHLPKWQYYLWAFEGL
jgi:hypothetical protein